MGSRGKGRDKKKEKDKRLNLVAGVKVEVRKSKGIFLFLKRYKGELGSKTTTSTIPRNDARNTCWYFLTLRKKFASARKYRCSSSSGSIQGIILFVGNGGTTFF